ncbi:hypothetical protein C8F04DRAFT_1178241 [Mycena alexandri]|uniref:Uncharacterized protein n=1 Tax=Mycena alexandri TaxID=1745969 RepID=A0AAD6T6N7_9AGAR|nr:hypothetical protein C8F04DRAFT_1178241 [Mycena alexandri]
MLIQVQLNTNSASTCLAMAWVTIYWVSALQLSPTYPSRDPQNSQRRVRTVQPNVDSPPQTHKITRTSLRRTNASSAAASSDEAEIESSKSSNNRDADAEVCAHSARATPAGPLGGDSIDADGAHSARRAECESGQKVCGSVRGRGDKGWVRVEMRREKVRARVRTHLLYASRTCGAARGDSTHMRSCVPAEREFAQTAIGADSARAGAACTYTRAGTTRDGVGRVRVGTRDMRGDG